MRETEFVYFFGDGEKRFCLTPDMIAELERSTGFGIGAIFGRVLNSQYSHAELTETIRLALIGGGESPARAFELVERYAKARPLGEVYPIVADIFAYTWAGSQKPTDEAAAEEQTNG